MGYKFGDSSAPSKTVRSQSADKYQEITDVIRALVPCRKELDDNWKFIEWPLIGDSVEDIRLSNCLSNAIRSRIKKVWGKYYKSQVLPRPNEATEGSNRVLFRVVYAKCHSASLEVEEEGEASDE